MREIVRLVTSSSPTKIERELTSLLHKVRREGGSPGTELVAAGFQPAPYFRERYGWEGDGVIGPTSVGVAIDGDRITVTAQVNKKDDKG